LDAEEIAGVLVKPIPISSPFFSPVLLISPFAVAISTEPSGRWGIPYTGTYSDTFLVPFVLIDWQRVKGFSALPVFWEWTDFF